MFQIVAIVVPHLFINVSGFQFFIFFSCLFYRRFNIWEMPSSRLYFTDFPDSDSAIPPFFWEVSSFESQAQFSTFQLPLFRSKPFKLLVLIALFFQ